MPKRAIWFLAFTDLMSMVTFRFFFFIISVVYDTHEGFKLVFAYFTDFRSTVASLLKLGVEYSYKILKVQKSMHAHGP